METLRIRNASNPDPTPPIDTWSEAWRHACEVRWVASLPTTHQRRDYLDAIEKRRGKPAADKLRQDLRELWQTRKRPDPHHD